MNRLLFLLILTLALPAFAYKPFTKGMQVTCIYNGVHSWSNGDQFTKTIPLTCKVLQASVNYRDIDRKGYQHLQVDCSADVERNTGLSAGVGLVKDHPLNTKVRWMTSEDCYQFVQ